MLGVELVTDRQQKTPANAEILHVMEQMKGTNIYIEADQSVNILKNIII